MFVDESVLWTSTTGASALTVMVSLVEACITALSFASWPTRRVTRCVATGANPSRLNRTS